MISTGQLIGLAPVTTWICPLATAHTPKGDSMVVSQGLAVHLLADGLLANSSHSAVTTITDPNPNK
jgi:hypothetical protein